MKTRIPLFALCAILASPGYAVEKKSRKSSGSTLPPTSPMLVVSATTETTLQPVEADGLITTKLSGRDLDFFECMLETGQLQVMLGELVKAKAESPLVKSVGTILASTQAQENQQINRLATLNGLTLSAAAAGAQRQSSAELEKLSGASFDAACVTKIVEANRQTVRAYEEGAESKIPEIQNFSTQMLPIARERLRIAEKMIEVPVKAAPGASAPTPPAPPTGSGTPSPTPGTRPAAPTPAPSATPPPLTLGRGLQHGPYRDAQPAPGAPSPVHAEAAPNADAQFLKSGESELPAAPTSATPTPDSAKQP